MSLEQDYDCPKNEKLQVSVSKWDTLNLGQDQSMNENSGVKRKHKTVDKLHKQVDFQDNFEKREKDCDDSRIIKLQKNR